jgi:hypothetical protein
LLVRLSCLPSFGSNLLTYVRHVKITARMEGLERSVADYPRKVLCVVFTAE